MDIGSAKLAETCLFHLAVDDSLFGLTAASILRAVDFLLLGFDFLLLGFDFLLLGFVVSACP